MWLYEECWDRCYHENFLSALLMGPILRPGFPYWCANINDDVWYTPRWPLDPQRESQGTQQQDNEAATALNYKTLGCSSVRQKILLATSEIVSCPSCSKGLTQVEKFVECNGGYFLQTEKKNGIRKLKVLEIASRKTVLQVDKRILCCVVTAYEFRSEVKMEAILNHKLMPVPLSLAKIISHNLRTGNKSF